ncbi:hypothetical protein [Gulosibacter sp. 10]|uniref:hypothetical protein n=1 Tax=Gulosibacter sp. 10 TaxID=1255570 RepID=UPI00097F27D1|nr:hypothetical protein [Gulosibacter sp. 10]SJM52007.1 hypothetical protein FM112_02345 [Gulosibacter sp. 10]
MPLLVLEILQPLLIGAPVALLVFWLRRPASAPLPRPSRRTAVAALAVVLLGPQLLGFALIALLALFDPRKPWAPIGNFDSKWHPFAQYWVEEVPLADMKWRLIAPLAFAIIAVVVMLFASRRTPTNGSAVLAPRTALTFASRGWIVSGALVLALVVLTAVTAGLTSVPAFDGKHKYVLIDVGGTQLGIEVYGWYYSALPLLLLLVLLLLCWAALRRIAARPLADAPEADAAVRRRQTFAVLSITTGALLVHLGLVWLDLANTWSALGAGPLMEVSGPDVEGATSVFTTGPALETPLRVMGHAASATGYAVWCYALASFAVSRRRAVEEPAAEEPSAAERKG